MLINRKVTLKSVVTEEFRKQFSNQVQSMISEIKIELDKLKSSEQQLMLKSGSMDYNQIMQIKEQLEREKSSREATIKELESRMNQVSKMNDGDLFNQGLLEGTTEIKVGDNLDSKLGAAEIVVKDGIVQSITEG
ncbi:MAG: YlqD family protein [Caldisericia bacterium]